jgi:hypothetical protein
MGEVLVTTAIAVVEKIDERVAQKTGVERGLEISSEFFLFLTG